MNLVTNKGKAYRPIAFFLVGNGFAPSDWLTIYNRLYLIITIDYKLLFKGDIFHFNQLLEQYSKTVALNQCSPKTFLRYPARQRFSFERLVKVCHKKQPSKNRGGTAATFTIGGDMLNVKLRKFQRGFTHHTLHIVVAFVFVP